MEEFKDGKFIPAEDVKAYRVNLSMPKLQHMNKCRISLMCKY
jgi:hypothetical protein